MNVFDYLFEESRELNKLFVLNEKDSISYKELYELALNIAAHLKSNYGSGQTVILIAPNSVFFIATYLGILKSGNICVPLDYAIEPANLEYIVTHVESKIAFIAKSVAEKLKFAEGMHVYFEQDVLSFKVHSSHNDHIEKFESNSLAEIVFTSGSTGIPKGVMLSHENIIANTWSILQYLKLTKEDTICAVLPFHYCYGLSLLHTHLRVGGSMVLNNAFMFIGSVLQDIKKFKCTGFAGVPSHYQILLRKTSIFSKDDLPYLRYFTQAGGKLHNQFIEEICRAVPNKKFYVMYGQTEATARLSYLPSELAMAKIGSIGRAIPGVELKVVNENGKELTDGAEGELVAKGKNIMLGYYKDPDETARTVKDGWLYTGDFARKDDEGYIYILARKKEIIKVRGKRVSPKEIEEVILGVTEVMDCTIKSFHDEILGEGMEAIVVISDLSIKEEVERNIKSICRNKLASFKIPTKFSFYNQMNLKSSGKKTDFKINN